MKKEFDRWNEKKKWVHDKTNIPYFKDGEVWWIYLGVNVGIETDGKGEEFVRPVLILKKYNHYSFLAIPLSTSNTINKYKISIGTINQKQATINISQMRNIDSRRLTKKICKLNKTIFEEIKTKASQVIFG